MEQVSMASIIKSITLSISFVSGRLVMFLSFVAYILMGGKLNSESVFVTIFKNYKRVALVWLDEYKQLIYAVNPDIKRLNGGDVSDRIKLRQSLNCSSSKDYLKLFQLKNFPFNYRYIGSVS